MIQTVIFDMDGVIIDSEPIHFDIEKQIFEELKIAISFEEHCSYVGTSSRNMWEMIIKKHEIANDLEELIKKDYAMYMKHLIAAKDLHPIPGVVELIKELHQDNLKIIVASSSHGEVIDMVLKKFNLSEYFNERIFGMNNHQAQSEKKLHRVLSLNDLIIYGIILIQPVAALPLFGHANAISRGHAVTSILIAMIGMILTAISYGRMANMY